MITIGSVDIGGAKTAVEPSGYTARFSVAKNAELSPKMDFTMRCSESSKCCAPSREEALLPSLRNRFKIACSAGSRTQPPGSWTPGKGRGSRPRSNLPAFFRNAGHSGFTPKF